MLSLDPPRELVEPDRPSANTLDSLRVQYELIETPVMFSLVCSIGDEHEIWTRRTVESILAQIHTRFELIVCDNGSPDGRVAQLLGELAPDDPRVRCISADERVHPATAVNAATEIATGDFVALVGVGDLLTPDALFTVAELCRPDTDLVYTDELLTDEVDAPRGRVRKPDYSPELQLASPYIGRLCAIRRSVLDSIGQPLTSDAWEEDLLLRVCERVSEVRHLRQTSYVRRLLPALEKPKPADRIEAVGRALERRGEDAVVTAGYGGRFLRIMRRPTRAPQISVIVNLPPAAPHAPLVDDLELRTGLRPVEMLVTGGRPDAVPGAERIDVPGAAASANRAAQRATGEMLLFVDGRARLRQGVGPGWLAGLAAIAERPGTGLVGCRIDLHGGRGLLYGGLAAGFEALSPNGGLASAVPEVALCASNPAFVPAGLMLVDALVFDELGGFREAELGGALYDLDLGLRARAAGLANVYSPNASIVTPAAGPVPTAAEIAFVWEHWWDELQAALTDQPGSHATPTISASPVELRRPSITHAGAD